MGLTKEDILKVRYNNENAISIQPMGQTFSSFARQKLRDDLEATIENNLIKKNTKATIIASGKNVPLTLDYACKNSNKIEKLILQIPKIPVANVDFVEYYWGNFPLSALNTSALKQLKIIVQNKQSVFENNHSQAIIQLCFDAGAMVYTASLDDPNPEKNMTKITASSHMDALLDIKAQERNTWLCINTLNIMAGSVLFYTLYKKLYNR
jgi:hypothetical protein